MDLTSVAPGFMDPVMDAQRTFRVVLSAMSRPGTVHALPAMPAVVPPRLAPTTASLALTLLDGDTSVWLSPSLAGITVESFLRFHTACRIESDPGKAMFALIGDVHEMPALDAFAQGSDAYPDRSSTVLVQVRGFTDGFHVRWHGPGILDAVAPRISDLCDSFFEEWRANQARFPRGVDVMFVGPSDLVGMPRTVGLSRI